MENEDYSSAPDDAEPYSATGRGGDRKRRFTEEQIKSLESMFESQVKLEPRKKLQLARELGLQPRQVAIWFQNKRARWKSKQLERQYAALQADYDGLLSSFESMKKEKLVLAKQLQKLTDLLKRPPSGSSNDDDSDNGNGSQGKEIKKREDNEWTGLLLTEAAASHPSVVLYSDEEAERKLSFVSQDDEADGLLYWGEPASSAGYVTSHTDRRDCFDGSCSPEKQPCNGAPQWWEFWPISE